MSLWRDARAARAVALKGALGGLADDDRAIVAGTTKSNYLAETRIRVSSLRGSLSSVEAVAPMNYGLLDKLGLGAESFRESVDCLVHHV